MELDKPKSEEQGAVSSESLILTNLHSIRPRDSLLLQTMTTAGVVLNTNFVTKDNNEIEKKTVSESEDYLAD